MSEMAAGRNISHTSAINSVLSTKIVVRLPKNQYVRHSATSPILSRSSPEQPSAQSLKKRIAPNTTQANCTQPHQFTKQLLLYLVSGFGWSVKYSKIKVTCSTLSICATYRLIHKIKKKIDVLLKGFLKSNFQNLCFSKYVGVQSAIFLHFQCDSQSTNSFKLPLKTL